MISIKDKITSVTWLYSPVLLPYPQCIGVEVMLKVSQTKSCRDF